MFAVLASVLFSPMVYSQVNNPGVTQSGAVVAGHGVEWVGNNRIRDSGAPFPTGDITDVAITSSGSITITGSPCATGACAFTTDLPAVVVGASVGSATVAPVLTFDNFGRVTNISSATIAPPFSAITGSLACSQTPALTGDITTAAGSCATSIAAGVIVNADINAAAAMVLTKLETLGANVVIGATSATTPIQLAVPSCSGAASALTWTSGSGFGCNTIAAGGTVTTVTPGAGLVSSVTASCSQSNITVTGTLSKAECVNAQTGTSYAFVDGDRAKLVTAVNAAAQAYSIAQAGAASAFQSGWYVDLKNNSTNVAGIVTVTPATSTINGAATLTLYPGQSVRITSDGTNYQTAFTAVHVSLTNSLGADVALNNTANYFDGPTVAQGPAGVWFASGAVTLNTNVGSNTYCKLWDGTTVAASTAIFQGGSNEYYNAALTGIFINPAGNIRISCRNLTTTAATISFNISGNSKDSTIAVMRIQ